MTYIDSVISDITTITDRFFTREYGYTQEVNAAIADIRKVLSQPTPTPAELIELPGITRVQSSNFSYSPTLEGPVYGIKAENQPSLGAAFDAIVADCDKWLGYEVADDLAWELATYAERQLALDVADPDLRFHDGSAGFSRERVLMDGTVVCKDNWNEAHASFKVPTAHDGQREYPCRIFAFGEMEEVF